MRQPPGAGVIEAHGSPLRTTTVWILSSTAEEIFRRDSTSLLLREGSRLAQRFRRPSGVPSWLLYSSVGRSGTRCVRSRIGTSDNVEYHAGETGPGGAAHRVTDVERR